jgi:Tfp pilus assembly protein PilN
VKAVNLVPGDARRSSGVAARGSLGPGYATLGLLAVALAFVTLYVTSSNTIAQRQAQLTSLQGQTAQAQAQAATLKSYVSFEQLAQARVQTVRQIAGSRFDWYAALSDLSKVVPATTSLQSLYASVAPGATVASTGSGAAVAGSLRADLSVPAIELTGCSKSQDDVARLMSRLRLVNGVSRVTLGDSQKPDAVQSTSQQTGCPVSFPLFDLVVFFQPLPGAPAAGSAATAAAGAAPAAAAASTTAPVSSTPSSPSPTATTQAVTTTTPAGGSK